MAAVAAAVVSYFLLLLPFNFDYSEKKAREICRQMLKMFSPSPSVPIQSIDSNKHTNRQNNNGTTFNCMTKDIVTTRQDAFSLFDSFNLASFSL